MTLRLVIPAYNEAANLPSLCDRIRSALSGPSPVSYAIYIVDDGSRDGTQEVVRRLTKDLPIALLTHPQNQGISQVFLTGFRAALKDAGPEDIVAVLEGDGTSDPALLSRMIEALEGPCDIVIASRHVPGGAYRYFPLKRLMLSRAANALLRLVCRMPGVRDYTIFYRAYRSGVLRRALEAHGQRLTSVGGFACNAEMLLRMRRWVRGVREIPFVYDYSHKKGKSSMRIAGNLGSYLKLFRIFFGETGDPR